METMVLMGAEQVERAGHNIKSAAESLHSTASMITDSAFQQRIWMEEWITRFEQAVDKMSRQLEHELSQRGGE